MPFPVDREWGGCWTGHVPVTVTRLGEPHLNHVESTTGMASLKEIRILLS